MSSQGPLPVLHYCGVEIANAARTVEYLKGGLANTMQGHWDVDGGGLCGVLYRMNGGTCFVPEVFINPSVDPAPWHDATEPGSAEFLGLVLLDITGYDSTLTRVVTPRIQGLGGASFSGQRRGPRVWKFRAAMVSGSDAGAEYGLRWLTSALETSGCSTCATCELTVRLSCPPDDCSDDTVGEWVSYDAALSEGPFEVEKWAPSVSSMEDTMAGCRDLVIVEWVMTAGNPFLYKPVEACLAPETLGVDTVCTDICDFLFGDPGDPHCCPVEPPTSGTVGAIFTFTAVADTGPILLQAYTQCPASDEYDPVLEMEITGVAAGATVVVDCARHRITQTIAGVEEDAEGLIDLSEGRTLQWIEARDCDQDVFCFCARTAHPCSQGGTTTVQIDTQLREG